MKAREYYGFRIVLYTAFLVAILIGIGTQADWNDPSTPIYCLLLAGAVGLVIAWDVWDYSRSRPDQDYGFSDAQVRAWAAQNSRMLPGILLVVGVGLTVLALTSRNTGHRWLTGHVAAPFALLMGLAGTLHPPLYYALWPAVRTDGRTRALAYAIAGVGLLLGMYWAWIVRGR